MRCIVFVLLLTVPVAAYPNTINVPGDYSTIQAAIDVAVNGDMVLVSPGVYLENIDFKGKAIHVKSNDGPSTTFIDGSMPINPDQGSVVTFTSGEDSDSIIDGFTLYKGLGTNNPSYVSGGGGVFCDESSPTIINNIVKENININNSGGGILCIDSSPTICSNEIINNITTGQGGGIGIFGSGCPEIYCNNISDNSAGGLSGGGIYYFNNSAVTEATIIKNNNITYNSAAQQGGGLYFTGDCFALVEANRIINNTAEKGAGISCICHSHKMLFLNNSITDNSAYICGGGLLCAENNNDYDIINNAISRNYAGAYGAGICCTDENSPLISNNIISFNETGGYGGGFYCGSDSSPLIQNNLIDKNQARDGAGLSCLQGFPSLVSNTITKNTATVTCGGVYVVSNSAIDIVNSIIYDNAANNSQGREVFAYTSCEIAVDYSDIGGGTGSVFIDPSSILFWGANMIDEDPLFVDGANRDYHLTYNSPCKDSGDNMAISEPFDFENDPRIAYGTVDMGADEFYNHFYCTGSFVPNGSIEGKFIGLPATWPVALFIGSGIMEPPLQHKWGKFYLESPWQLFPLVPMPANGVLVIPATLPLTPAPYDIPMQALIGWELSNLFVLEVR